MVSHDWETTARALAEDAHETTSRRGVVYGGLENETGQVATQLEWPFP